MHIGVDQQDLVQRTQIDPSLLVCLLLDALLQTKDLVGQSQSHRGVFQGFPVLAQNIQEVDAIQLSEVCFVKLHVVAEVLEAKDLLVLKLVISPLRNILDLSLKDQLDIFETRGNLEINLDLLALLDLEVCKGLGHRDVPLVSRGDRYLGSDQQTQVALSVIHFEHRFEHETGIVAHQEALGMQQNGTVKGVPLHLSLQVGQLGEPIVHEDCLSILGLLFVGDQNTAALEGV